MEEKNDTLIKHSKKRNDFNCSLGFTMSILGSKWRAVILWHILKTPAIRYGELKKSIPNISHKVFSQELKALEADDLITRTVYDENPPKVEYQSTQRGNSLYPILSSLCDWGKQYMAEHDINHDAEF